MLNYHRHASAIAGPWRRKFDALRSQQFDGADTSNLHESSRQTHAPHDFLKTWMSPKVIPSRINLDKGDLHFAFFERFFQISQSLFSFAQAVVNHREAVCG